MDTLEDSSDMQKLSKYNSGWIQIMRLDNLWKDTHNHSRNGSFLKWNMDLDRIWCELGGDLDDKDERIAKFKEYDGKLNTLLESFKLGKSGDKDKIYLLMMEKELFLRRLQNELGKGSAYHEGDEDYMDN